MISQANHTVLNENIENIVNNSCSCHMILQAKRTVLNEHVGTIVNNSCIFYMMLQENHTIVDENIEKINVKCTKILRKSRPVSLKYHKQTSKNQ